MNLETLFYINAKNADITACESFFKTFLMYSTAVGIILNWTCTRLTLKPIRNTVYMYKKEAFD